MNISQNDKLHFWVSISGEKLKETATLEDAYNFWYKKPRYTDLYDAIANIPYDKTFARTVHGIGKNPNREKIVRKGKDYVASRIKTLNVHSEAEFDAWHRECVETLIQIFRDGGQKLYIGQGQKWINMGLKHLFLADEAVLKDILPFCHIPLDNYLYDALNSKNTPVEFQGLQLPFEPSTKPWSRIDDYDAYLKFQKTFRTKSKEAPLVAEFNLWQSEKDLK